MSPPILPVFLHIPPLVPFPQPDGFLRGDRTPAILGFTGASPPHPPCSSLLSSSCSLCRSLPPYLSISPSQEAFYRQISTAPPAWIRDKLQKLCPFGAKEAAMLKEDTSCMPSSSPSFSSPSFSPSFF